MRVITYGKSGTVSLIRTVLSRCRACYSRWRLALDGYHRKSFTSIIRILPENLSLLTPYLLTFDSLQSVWKSYLKRF